MMRAELVERKVQETQQRGEREREGRVESERVARCPSRETLLPRSSDVSDSLVRTTEYN